VTAASITTQLKMKMKIEKKKKKKKKKERKKEGEERLLVRFRWKVNLPRDFQ